MNKRKKAKLLIIDDAETNITVLTRILSKDYGIFVARNGKMGIEAAKKYLPDVIILDIVMPNMDGYETIAALKKIEETRNTPVIFITGLSSAEDEEKGLALGGADYITKPFSEAVVKLRVRNQIRMLNYIRTIESLLMTDQLTGIANRRSFDERLLIEWKRAKREKAPISVLIFDIDHFKKYNDTYGHPQGDAALRAVAGTLKKAVRRPGDLVARWGGEEFIALLSNTDSEGALDIAEHSCKNIEKTVIHCEDGQRTSVTVSIGVNTQIPKQNDTIKKFIDCADDALYAAKAAGRNRVHKYNHEPEETQHINI